MACARAWLWPITVTANDISRVYGDANPALTYAVGGDGLVNGDTLSGALTALATTTSNVGGYGIAEGTLANSNYDITDFTGGTLTVTARPITVTGGSVSRIYGDANPALTYQLTSGSLVNGDTLSGTPVTAADRTSNVGGYAVTQGTVAASSNYDLTFADGTLTVTPRAISVTANDQSREYGEANPPLTYTVGGDGRVNDDSLSGALATGATASSVAGSYAITEGTLAASKNYDLTFVDGTLVVEAAQTDTPPDITSEEDLLGTTTGLGKAQAKSGPESNPDPGTEHLLCTVEGAASTCGGPS